MTEYPRDLAKERMLTRSEKGANMKIKYFERWVRREEGRGAEGRAGASILYHFRLQCTST